jgi:hypothetical protein
MSYPKTRFNGTLGISIDFGNLDIHVVIGMKRLGY